MKKALCNIEEVRAQTWENLEAENAEKVAL
jgi:hypothetical protein